MLRKKTIGSWTHRHREVMRKVGCRRKMGAEKTVRHWLVGRKEVRGMRRR